MKAITHALIALAALCLMAVVARADDNSLWPDAETGPAGSFTNGTSVSSTVDGDLKICKAAGNPNCSEINADTGAFFCTPPADDSAPISCSLKGRDTYALATGANRNATGIGISGGNGTQGFTSITQAGCAAQNVTVAVTTLSGTVTTTCSVGTTWTCATDDNTCAAGLAACLTAATNTTPYRLTNNVWVIPSSKVLKVALTSSANPACATVVSGTAGPVKVYGAATFDGLLTCTGGTSGCSAISSTGHAATDIYTDGHNISGGNKATDANADTVTLAGEDALATATTDKLGGTLKLAGGSGRRFFDVLAFDANVTLTATCNGIAYTAAGDTTYPTAGDFLVGTSVNATALAAKLFLAATYPALGTFTNSTAYIYFQPTAACHPSSLGTSNAGKASVTNGTDGGVAVNGPLTWSSSQYPASVPTISPSGAAPTVTIDCVSGNIQAISLSAASGAVTFGQPAESCNHAGLTLVLVITQHASAVCTGVWDASFLFGNGVDPILTPTVSAKDQVVCLALGGNAYSCSSQGDIK